MKPYDLGPQITFRVVGNSVLLDPPPGYFLNGIEVIKGPVQLDETFRITHRSLPLEKMG